MEIKKAVRTSVNLIMSVSGVSGSGKTYSALLLAAGLAGPGMIYQVFMDVHNIFSMTYSLCTQSAH